MKTVKKVFYGISFLILLTCIVILALAMNPNLSDKLSKLLYGEDGYVAEESESPAPEGTSAPQENEDDELITDYPQMTPLTPNTKEPVLSEEDLSEEEPEVVLNTITIKTVCPTSKSTKYKEPVATSLSVPENVGTLLGYVPVTAIMTEVTQAEADALEAELSIGEDGGMLVFNQSIYPYYHMLQGQERDLYRQIYANAFSLNGRFKPCEDIYSTQIGRVMEAVFNDHPILFWVDTAYGCKYNPDGKCVEITLQFNSTSQKLEQSQTTFKERAEEILSVAKGLDSDYEKEKYVHDKLVSKVSYNTEAANNQSAYSALVNGQTVCAGYARAFQYLMQQLGIPCYYCTGYSGDNHAWNIVELYGEYYNVDVTWDDTTPYTYDYFNCSDDAFASTHLRKSLSVKLPACTGTLYGGLEGEKDASDNQTAETPETTYSATVGKYYDTMLERICKQGRSNGTYTDIIAATAWHEMEAAYANGNSDFINDDLIRALHSVGADSCIITLTPEVVTENAYNITCSITVN